MVFWASDALPIGAKAASCHFGANKLSQMKNIISISAATEKALPKYPILPIFCCQLRRSLCLNAQCGTRIISRFTEEAMLVLSRKLGEKIVIDGHITVTVVAIQGNQVRLSFDAPDDVRILRGELTCGKNVPSRRYASAAAGFLNRN